MSEIGDTGDSYDPDFEETIPPPPPRRDTPVGGTGAPPPPPPPAGRSRELTDEEIRTWTIWAHASALVAAFFALAFMGPLVIWLLRKEIDPIAGAHAKEALNFNLTILVYGVVGFVLVFALIGFLLLPLIAIFWLVNIVRAIVAVNGGNTFRYPLTIRFVS